MVTSQINVCIYTFFKTKKKKTTAHQNLYYIAYLIFSIFSINHKSIIWNNDFLFSKLDVHKNLNDLIYPNVTFTPKKQFTTTILLIR